MDSLITSLQQHWRKTRPTLLIGTTVALILATLLSFENWRRAVDVNGQITALTQGRDLDVGSDSDVELVLARIAFLTARGKLDHSRMLLEALDRESDPSLRARGHYLMANALLRRALDQVEASQIEAAAPLVNLAKREYRRVLELAPHDWDARFNFDVAARLIRDFPEYEKKSGDELTADPRKLWTDVPGKPKGLP